MAGLIGLIIFIVLWRIRGRPVALPTSFLVIVARAVLLFITVFEIPLFLFAASGTAHVLGLVIWAPVAIIFCAPTVFLKWVVVPLGMPRVAYWTVRCCWPLGLIKELAAGGVMYAALALIRAPSSVPTLDLLQRRLNRAQSVQGAGIVAIGLLAALRRDRDQARRLLLMADTLDARLISRTARTVARDWLVVDAARIGNWREVIRLGRRGRASSRWSYGVARIAERLVGERPGCGDWLLWLCWIVAPRRWATFPLLGRALALPRAPRSVEPDRPVGTGLPQALADLARALKNRHARDDLLRSISAIDVQIDSEPSRARIQQRLEALGARRDTDTIVADFRKSLANHLAGLIEARPDLARCQHSSPVIEEAAAQVRNRLFQDVEAQCADYSGRLTNQQSLETVVEWEMWATLRDRADRLLQIDPGSEHVLFQTMYIPVCNFAVFQHNKCKRIALAHEMYAWLQRHSDSHPAASQLLVRNIRAALAWQ